MKSACGSLHSISTMNSTSSWPQLCLPVHGMSTQPLFLIPWPP